MSSLWEQEFAEGMKRKMVKMMRLKPLKQPEKVWALYKNMLMPFNHILQTVDDAPNICHMKIKPQKKVK